MNIYKVLPDLSRTKHMALWHKALRSQWSAEDIDWDRPQRITDARLKDQMGTGSARCSRTTATAARLSARPSTGA
jgi:hypothetical protein